MGVQLFININKVINDAIDNGQCNCEISLEGENCYNDMIIVCNYLKCNGFHSRITGDMVTYVNVYIGW